MLVILAFGLTCAGRVTRMEIDPHTTAGRIANLGVRIDEAVHQLVSEVLHAPATSPAATGRFAPVPFSQVRCSV